MCFQPPENPENGKQNDNAPSSMEVDEECENMDTDEQSTNISNDFKLKLISYVEDSRPGTPVEGSFVSTPTSSQTPQSINPCVRVLAKAVLEVLCLLFKMINNDNCERRVVPSRQCYYR